MPDSPLHYLSIAEASARIETRDLSAVELVESILKRAEETEPTVGAYTILLADEARAAAAVADKEIAAGNHKGPLHGIPVAIKDLYLSAGVVSRGGSGTMDGFVPDEDAEPLKRLRDAGAILLGKTTTTEFGYGQGIPPSKNPWKLDRYPGGSSVGSAVSVAVGSAAGALGTDAGGSVRSPAAWNGIVGVKPTYGIVPKRGVISPGPTVDHPGPLTRTVDDADILLSVIADEPYARSGPAPSERGDADLTGVRLGVDRDFFFSDSVQPQVRTVIEGTLKELEGLGATLIETKLARPDQVMAVVMLLLAVDVSFAHQKWLRERGDRYVPGTRLMLELGELISAVDYLRAVQFRNEFKQRVKETFEEAQLDALVMSTSPMTAIRLEDLHVPLGGGSSLLGDRIKHVAPFNLTGQPAISVPCGFSEEELPVGLQLVGRPYRDRELLGLARIYERATEWHTRRPPL